MAETEKVAVCVAETERLMGLEVIEEPTTTEAMVDVTLPKALVTVTE